MTSDNPDDDRPAQVIDTECLGAYPSLAAFAREVVTPLLRAEGLWLLDCLDLGRVLRVLRGDDRLRLSRGLVYLDRQPRPEPPTEPAQPAINSSPPTRR